MEWLCGGGVKVIRVRAKVQNFRAEWNGENILSFLHIFMRVWQNSLGNFFVMTGSFRLEVSICWRGIAYPKVFFQAHACGVTQNVVQNCTCKVFLVFLEFRLFFIQVWKNVTPKSLVPLPLSFFIFHTRSGLRISELKSFPGKTFVIAGSGRKKPYKNGIKFTEYRASV